MYGEQKNSNLWATVFLRLLVTIILITVVADVGRSDDSTGTPVFATQLDVTYLWQVLVVLAVIILSMVIWNRKLFKEIKFRKRVEEELLESEAKHRLLFDNANDAIFIHNMKARILAVNPMACERFGYTNTDMMSMTVNQVDSPEEAEHVHERIAMLMKNGHLTFDTVHHCKDGSPIPTEVSARRITWDGQPAVMSFCRDITKRKNSEEKIQQNESRLRMLVDILQHPSRSIQEFLDYALNQAIQLTESKIGYIYHYHEERKEFVLNTWSREVMAECTVANPSTCYELEKTGIWGEAIRQRRPVIVNDFQAANPLKKGYPEGHVQLYRFMTVPIFKNDSIVGVVGLANKETDYEESDILQVLLLMEAVWKVTERKRADESLMENEAKQCAMVANIADVITIVDQEGIIRYKSPNIEKWFGWRPDEFVGLLIWENVHPEDQNHTRQLFGELLCEPDATGTVECRYRCKDGSYKWIKLTAVNLVHDPHIRGVLLNYHDINERKRAEEEVLANRMQLTDIIEFLPDATLAIDKEGRIIIWNKAIEKMTGVPAAEMIGKGNYVYTIPFYGEARQQLIDLIFMDQSDVMARYPNISSEGDSLKAEVFCNALYSNKGAWVFVKASPLHDQSGNIIGSIESIRDITDRKQVEQELLNMNETLEHRVVQEVERNLRHEHLLIQQSRMAAMGEMIGNIAHQWRQPLNALGLLLFNIRDAYQFNTLDAAYLDQAVADGRRMVQKMSTTISDFSNFFRPDKEIIAFSALEQIREAVSLVESSFQHSNISIHIDALQDLKLPGFPNEYSQVLLNLLYNAKEAILVYNKELPGRVNLTLTEQDGWGCVSVCDNGGGIKEDILDRIFDPYFSTKGKGSGIGLYMSKMIIERNMNGSITAKNIEGGVEFSVCTPLITALSKLAVNN